MPGHMLSTIGRLSTAALLWMCAGYVFGLPRNHAEHRALGASAPAQATPYPEEDQSTCNAPVGGEVSISGTTWKAQTFVSGMVGALVRVQVPGTNLGGTTVMHVRGTDADGRPEGPDLGFAAIACGTAFVFEPGVPITVGKLYALVIEHEDRNGTFAWRYSSAPTCYRNPLGTSYTSTNAGRTWGRDQLDFMFTTYVRPIVNNGRAAGPFPVAGCPTPGPTTPPTPTEVPPTPTPAQLPVVDQITCPDAGGQMPATGDAWLGQLFVAGLTGRLVRVVLPGANAGGSTTVRLQAAPGGVPDGVDLARSGVACGTQFHFGGGPHVVAGQTYFLALDNAGAVYDWAYGGRPDCYAPPGGMGLASPDAGATWQPLGLDFQFTTIVRPDSFVEGHAPITLEPLDCIPGPSAPLEPLRTLTALVISLPTGPPANYSSKHVLALAHEYAAAVESASRYRGYANPNARPSLRYQIYQDRAFQEGRMPPKARGSDYNIGWLFDAYDVCKLAQAGAVDEVWIWEGGQGGLPEWIVTGPEWTSYNPYLMPNCGRTMATMVLHNGLSVDYALHSFGHRLESTFRTYFPCDLFSATWPWNGASVVPVCGARVNDRNGLVARPFAGNNGIGVCGDIHHPPNGDKDYEYGRQNVVDSICEDWQREGPADVKHMNCQAWHCTQEGFMTWWMQNLPGFENNNRNDQGGLQPNWWGYLFGRPPAVPTRTPPAWTVTPTSTLTPTSTSTPVPSATPTLIPTPTETVTPTASATAGIEQGTIHLPYVSR